MGSTPGSIERNLELVFEYLTVEDIGLIQLCMHSWELGGYFCRTLHVEWRNVEISIKVIFTFFLKILR